MKKYVSYRLIIAMISIQALLGSCTNFLEEEVPDEVGQDSWYRTEEEAVKSLYGVHIVAREVYRSFDFLSITDLLTDDMDYSLADVPRVQLRSLTFDTRNRYIEDVWRKLYTTINNANLVIDKVDQITPKPVSADQIKSEALTIRAWANFLLVQLWGEVPLLEKPTYKAGEAGPKREMKEKIYEAIFNDLLFASEHLGDTPAVISKGQFKYPLVFTASVPNLLLAKAYLVTKNYPKSVEYAQKIIGKYSLAPSYGNLFDMSLKRDKKRLCEVMWEFEFDAVTNFDNKNHRDFLPVENALLGFGTNGYGAYYPSTDLFMSFDPTDLRYKAMYRIPYKTDAKTPNPPCILKNFDPVTNQNTAGGQNIIILRYADALLTLAEGINETQGPAAAEPYLNQVRQRAGLANITGLSKDEMREKIFNENRWEFAHEGHRLFDLRRTGRYLSVMKALKIKMDNLVDMGSDYKMSFPNPGPVIEAVKNAVEATGAVYDHTVLLPAPFTGNTNIKDVGSNDKFLLHPIPEYDMSINPNLGSNNPNW